MLQRFKDQTPFCLRLVTVHYTDAIIELKVGGECSFAGACSLVRLCMVLICERPLTTLPVHQVVGRRTQAAGQSLTPKGSMLCMHVQLVYATPPVPIYISCIVILVSEPP